MNLKPTGEYKKLTKKERKLLEVAVTLKKQNKRDTVSKIALAMDLDYHYLKGLFTTRICEMKDANPDMTIINIGKSLGLSECTTRAYRLNRVPSKDYYVLEERPYDEVLHRMYMAALFGLGGFSNG